MKYQFKRNDKKEITLTDFLAYIPQKNELRLQNYHIMQNEFNNFLLRFAGLMYLSVAAPEVQILVAHWQNFITNNLFACNNKVLAEFCIFYLEDERIKVSLDKIAPGLAGFISEAVKVYLGHET